MEYNGWTNYATWNVNLWIENEEAIYLDKVSLLRRKATIEASDVEAFAREWFPNGTPDMQDESDSDYNMSGVNWAEIAEHWQIESEEI